MNQSGALIFITVLAPVMHSREFGSSLRGFFFIVGSSFHECGSIIPRGWVYIYMKVPTFLEIMAGVSVGCLCRRSVAMDYLRKKEDSREPWVFALLAVCEFKGLWAIS